jgi:hypothetical protein
VRRTILPEVENVLTGKTYEIKTRPSTRHIMAACGHGPPCWPLAGHGLRTRPATATLAVKNAKMVPHVTTADMELKAARRDLSPRRTLPCSPSRATTSPHAFAARPGDCIRTRCQAGTPLTRMLRIRFSGLYGLEIDDAAVAAAGTPGQSRRMTRPTIVPR